MRRSTHQKTLILNTIIGTNKHYTADEVLGKVREIDPNIGLATVYRNLALFAEEGKIQKISGEGWSYFDGNPHPHDHLHCQCCGQIMDIEGEYDHEVDQMVATRYNAKVISHTTTYEGICQNCLLEQDN